jgi:uncharacterized coiled-coil protein SlyX
MVAAKKPAPASSPKGPKKYTDKEWLEKIEAQGKTVEKLEAQLEKKKAEAKATRELLVAATKKLHSMSKNATNPGPLFGAK